MIAKLVGVLDYKDDDSIIVDVQGVGYEVFVPSSYSLSVSQNLCFYIQSIIREDSIALYGFENMQQKRLFNLLITVHGVGPRLALVILSTYSIDNIIGFLIKEDLNALKAISGIGIKVAQRLTTELKDKVTKIFNVADLKLTGAVVNISIKGDSIYINSEAEQALKAFGYNGGEIKNALNQINENQPHLVNTEDLIKEALKYFAKGL